MKHSKQVFKDINRGYPIANKRCTCCGAKVSFHDEREECPYCGYVMDIDEV